MTYTPHLLAALTGLLLTACHPQTVPGAQDSLVMALNLPITTAPPLALTGQTLTGGGHAVQVTPSGTATLQTDGQHDFLTARFILTNRGAGTFDQLSLVAVARQANVGGTALRSITNFGGTLTAEALRERARLTVPTHPVNLSRTGDAALVPGTEDFQAFTAAEVSALAQQSGWTPAFGKEDTPLNYGFVARACTLTAASCAPSGGRRVPPGGSAVVHVALRLPHGTDMTYDFGLSFALVDQDVTRVTRSVLPPESATDALARLTDLTTGGEVAQLNPAEPLGPRGVRIPQVFLTADGLDTLTVLSALRSAPLGQVRLTLSPDSPETTTDTSGSLTFTPGVFSDVDDVTGGQRYVTRTYRVTNTTGRTLRNVTLRAVALPGNLAGTAVTEVRSAPTAVAPGGTLLPDPAYAQTFQPVQRTVLGASRPELDPSGASFQAYRQAETQTLTVSGARVLDYGFTTGGAAPRALPPGGSTLISVAYRLPRQYGTQPRTYSAQLSFLVTTDDAVRVSQGSGESRADLTARAASVGGAVQAVTTDGQGPLLAAPTGVLSVESGPVRTGDTVTLGQVTP